MITTIQEFIRVIECFKLKKTERPWEVHTGDIVLNKSKWRDLKKEVHLNVTNEQISSICQAFHKFFRVADLKDKADIDMYNAINKLDDKDYHLAMVEALKSANISTEE